MEFKLFIGCKLLIPTTIFILFSVLLKASGEVQPDYFVSTAGLTSIDANIITLDHSRQRRDTALPSSSTAPPLPVQTSPAVVTPPTTNVTTTATVNSTIVTPVNNTAQNVTVPKNASKDSNVTTTKLDEGVNSTIAPAVTKVPLLGENGTGQYHGNNTPKVSEPINPDENISIEVFKTTIKQIEAEHNISNLTYDNHTYYNSTFIGNNAFFQEHWANITKPKAEVHPVLSNSHRRASTLKLSFDFPFYGQPLRQVTVATGGFIYTGDHVHNWLAATQYIAPLMANFDTSGSDDSVVKLYDDGEKFTAVWENVTLQEDQKKFTFAATLYKNGDIIFAYKTVPIPISEIDDKDHPVKVGISDAYLTDRIAVLLRTKTIYEYHRVSFSRYQIKNFTVLKLLAQPTCLQYNTCESCTNHKTAFNCSWCDQIQRCSRGIDRRRQDWVLRSCDKTQIFNESSCPATSNITRPDKTTTYVTDSKINPLHNTTIKTNIPNIDAALQNPNKGSVDNPRHSSVLGDKQLQPSHSPIGGVVVVLILVTLSVSLGAWVLYAFKNPHTRSGQLLIKYRPSQWSWRRGEARYTAATIHM